VQPTLRRLLAGAVVAAAVAALWLPAGAPGLGPPIAVYPIPGGRVASPRTQIAFRGLPAAQLGSIVVSGSGSGVHPGRIVADSDGRGASFIPATRFTPGETVTVSTSLNVTGGSGGAYQFTVAKAAGGLPPNHWPRPSRARNDVVRFRSRPDLAPARAVLRARGRTSSGDIFLAPQWGPVQDGPMIVDPNGHVVWFDPLLGDDSAADFRVQTYQGRPVLTWWQGYVTAGVGVGEDVIADGTYRAVAIVHAANGLSADLHEFELTSRGTALITAYYPVVWDARSAHGSRREIVLDSVIQEIDIPTGNVLFQWDSLDHVPVSDSYASPPTSVRQPYDYFHANSIEPDKDGKLVISARNTWAAYKIDPQTSATIWELGGKHSSFRLARGVRWAFQHDVRVRASNDLFVTLFDDGAGPPTVEKESHGIKLVLDLRHMTVRRAALHVHRPSLSSNFEGNFQQLPNRDDFIGWGQQPYFTEYDRHGHLVLDGHFLAGTPSYRAYRFPWIGTPAGPPAIAASTRRGLTTVYASWNGTTTTSVWRVLGGRTPTALRPLRRLHRSGFETAIHVRGPRYVAVQALDPAGHVLGTSSTISAS
jgi:Arylsulfotransferase (ASST)